MAEYEPQPLADIAPQARAFTARESFDRRFLAADPPQAERRADVEAAFALAKLARLSLAAKPQVRAGVAVLQVPIPDRPGSLADLTLALSEARVNIEDLQIVHSPEGGRGVVHLTVAADAADTAGVALAERAFQTLRLA